MNLELNDKVVIITGGTGGIGSQIVADFLEEGAVVACLIRNKNKIEVLQKHLEETNIPIHNLHAYDCSLLDFNTIKKVTKQVAIDLKRIDVLVNCAGFAHEYPFALLNENHINEMIDLNLKSPIYLSQAVLRYMYKQKGGNIINISSITSVKKGRGIAVYAAAKAGLDTFTRALAIEVGRKNIRINCIRPGVIDTTMSEALLDRVGPLINESTSLGRPGRACEISRLVLCIASNKVSSYMTGECINIDGGFY